MAARVRRRRLRKLSPPSQPGPEPVELLGSSLLPAPAGPLKGHLDEVSFDAFDELARLIPPVALAGMASRDQFAKAAQVIKIFKPRATPKKRGRPVETLVNRLAALMKKYPGKTVQSLAETLGMSESWVKLRRRQIRSSSPAQ